MSVFGRLSRGETTIDFVGNRKRWYTLSAVFLGLALVALLVRGLHLGLEFEGGTAIEADNVASATLDDFRSAVVATGVTDARIQLINGGQAVRIQTGPLSGDQEQNLIDAVAATSGSPRNENSVESVGPTFGALVARQAVKALVVFLAVVALFITWRLEWKMAMAGLAALLHDIAITVGVYAITGFEVTPATVVALLTILGYSLYDTVVVFDKVEELEHDLSQTMTYTGIVNRSMNQVLFRSLNTSLTSLLPVGSLLFVGAILLGATTLQDFALALFVGIASGTYSSLFVAAPLLATWKEKEPEWVAHRERLERRAAGLPSTPPRRRRTQTATTTERLPLTGGAAPRAPRKKKSR